MESDGDKHNLLSFAWCNGVSVNKEGGYYFSGRQYGVEKKLAVRDCYEYKKQLYGGRPNLMEIAREHKVSRNFVRKIESELYKNDGRVIYPGEITSEMVSRWALGPGSIALDEGDCFTLICLMRKKPTRSIGSYVHELYRLRGKTVSKRTIYRFVNQIRSGLCDIDLMM